MRVQDIVLAVNEVHKWFGPKIGSLPIPAQKIKAYIESVLKIQIVYFDKLSHNPQNLYGRYYLYEEDGVRKAKIFVADSLNYCWIRIVACKELSHLLIDKEEQFTKDPLNLIGGLINFELPKTIDEDIQSEHLAVFAATELLIPWRLHRSLILNRLANGEKHYDIALTYKLPEKMVAWWASEPYQALMEEAWRDIDSDSPPIPNPDPEPPADAPDTKP